MTKKKSELSTMVDGIWSARTTERLIEQIDDGHYDVVSLLTGIDPTFSGNLFKRLRDAVLSKDARAVRAISNEMEETLDKSLCKVRRIMQDLLAVIGAFPEAYSGNEEMSSGG